VTEAVPIAGDDRSTAASTTNAPSIRRTSTAGRQTISFSAWSQSSSARPIDAPRSRQIRLVIRCWMASTCASRHPHQATAICGAA